VPRYPEVVNQSTAISRGIDSSASVAGPPSPEKPFSPVPAMIETSPEDFTSVIT
jgi:hypothetical protein